MNRIRRSYEEQDGDVLGRVSALELVALTDTLTVDRVEVREMCRGVPQRQSSDGMRC